MEFKCQVNDDIIVIEDKFDDDNDLYIAIASEEKLIPSHVFLDVDQVKQLKNYLELLLENHNK